MSEFTTADPTEEALSSSEIERALVTLTNGEKTALVKIARLYARKRNTSYEYQDLIHEAYVRALDQRRKWPRGLPAVKFLGGVIVSLAWEWKSDFSNLETDLSDEGSEGRGTLAKLEVIEIIHLFDDDPLAQKIVVGLMEGAKGEELQQVSGLSDLDYETKRKKIRRRIEKYQASES